MPHYKAPLRDVRFLINEVFDYPAHYAQLSNARTPRPTWWMPSWKAPPPFAKKCWPP
jgi:hypothetical protein